MHLDHLIDDGGIVVQQVVSRRAECLFLKWEDTEMCKQYNKTLLNQLSQHEKYLYSIFPRTYNF